MPPQKKNNIGLLEAGMVIGLVSFMDMIQGVGQWAIAFIMAVMGPGLFYSSLVGKVTATVVNGVLGGVPGLLIGLMVGAIFSFFMSIVIGVSLFWYFLRKGIPRIMVFSILGSAVIPELIPYFNTVPAWTSATILLVTGSNGFLRKMAEWALMAFTGGLSGAAVSVAERKVATQVAKRAVAHVEKNIEEKQDATQGKSQRSAPLQIDGIRTANDNRKQAGERLPYEPKAA